MGEHLVGVVRFWSNRSDSDKAEEAKFWLVCLAKTDRTPIRICRSQKDLDFFFKSSAELFKFNFLIVIFQKQIEFLASI